MRKLTAMILTAAMVLGLAACGSGSPSAAEESSAASESTAGSGSESVEESGEAEELSGDEFVIGTYLQLSGQNAVYGVCAKNAIDLAAKQINEAGGLNGQTVVVKHYDTTGSTEEAVKVVQKMISDDHVNAIMGSVNSNEVAAAIGYINEAKIYNFGLGTSPTWMEDDSMIYTFRAAGNNGRIAPVSAEVVKNVMGYETVAIISGTDDAGSSTADAFEEKAEEIGLTITTRQECDTDDTDFSGQITQILATDPDTIFMSLIGATFGPFVKQVRNMGYTGTILCKEAFAKEFMDVAGVESSNYVYFTYPYVSYTDIEDCDIPALKEFLQNYLDEFGELPPQECAYRGYESMMVLWEAAKIAGKNDSDSLREATHQITMEGFGGTLDYTGDERDGYKECNSYIVIDGKNIVLQTWIDNGGYEEYKAAAGRDR